MPEGKPSLDESLLKDHPPTFTYTIAAMSPQTSDTFITDGSNPFNQRLSVLSTLVTSAVNGDEGATKALKALLKKAASSAKGADDLAKEKIAKLEEAIGQIMQGPLEVATFRRKTAFGKVGSRAELLGPSGEPVFAAIADDTLEPLLGEGTQVLVGGGAIVDVLMSAADIGTECVLERRVGKDRVELSHKDERAVVLASEDLIRELDDGDVTPGDSVVASPRGKIAYRGAPKSDGLDHFQYLDRTPVPDVLIERDIGAPPAYISAALEHVRIGMETPKVFDKWNIRHSFMALLEGAPGTGKTYSIEAMRRAMRDLAAEVAGIKPDDVPPLTVRLRTSEVLSHWLGQSDKNLDRVFDETEELASQEIEGKGGKLFPRPILLIFEEIEALSRTRGADSDSVYDRIQTTLLQRLDPSSHGLTKRLIVVLGTTNVGNLVDRAFIRRIGGIVERFGALDEESARSVLSKQLSRRPLTTDTIPEKVTEWLFRNGDEGLVDIRYHGHPNEADIRHRRDFLTGGLVDRSIQDACRVGIREKRKGLTLEMLQEAIDRQCRAIVERLDARSVGQYLELPDGLRVQSVERLT